MQRRHVMCGRSPGWPRGVGRRGGRPGRRARRGGRRGESPGGGAPGGGLAARRPPPYTYPPISHHAKPRNQITAARCVDIAVPMVDIKMPEMPKILQGQVPALPMPKVRGPRRTAGPRTPRGRSARAAGRAGPARPRPASARRPPPARRFLRNPPPALSSPDDACLPLGPLPLPTRNKPPVPLLPEPPLTHAPPLRAPPPLPPPLPSPPAA